MYYVGDFLAGSTVKAFWNTNGANGASITRSGNGTLKIYSGTSLTERASLNGVTQVEDFDGITGVHTVSIDTSDNTDLGFYAVGNDYTLVYTGMTIDGVTVNAAIATFSLQNRNERANVIAVDGDPLHSPHQSGQIPADLYGIQNDNSITDALTSILTDYAEDGELDVHVVSIGADAINAASIADDATSDPSTIATAVETELSSQHGDGQWDASGSISDVWTAPERTLTDGSIRVATPHQVGAIEIIRGGSYYNADNNAVTIAKGDEFTWPSDLASASGPAWAVKLYLEPTTKTLKDHTGAASLNVTGLINSATEARFDLSVTNTTTLTVGTYKYTAVATRATTPAKERLLESGICEVVDDIATA